MNLKPVSGIKACPSCGKSFHCAGEEDCWCEKVRISKKAMVEIMNSFTDCLCPDCLEKLAGPQD